MKVIFIEEIDFMKQLMKKETMGGIETNTRDVISELKKRGHEVYINTTPPKGERPDVVASSTYGPYAIYKLYSLKEKYKCACVQHAHTTAEDLQGGFLPNIDLFNKTLIPIYIRKLYSYAHIIITPTDYSAYCLKNTGINKLIKVLSNGVKLEKFMPEKGVNHKSRFRDYLMDKYKIDHGKPVIINCGYTWKRKGIDTFYRVAKKLPQYEFVWTGPIVENEYTKAAAKVPNLKFTGFYDDIRDAYYGGDIFFFPSYVENQGIPLIEAAVCEIPIVTRDILPFNWLTHEQHCFKGKTDEDFIKIIPNVVEMGSAKNTILENAKRLAIDLHDFNKIGDRIEEVYHQAEIVRKIHRDKYGML